MAIIFEQQSECPLCHHILDEKKAYMLVPPLTGNVLDPLFIFSDAGVHIACVDSNELKEKLMYHINRYDSTLPGPGVTCAIDGKEITDPREVLGLGLLTSDESDALYQFNYLTLNLKNLRSWNKLNAFLDAAATFTAAGKWEGLGGFNKIERIIDLMKSRI